MVSILEERLGRVGTDIALAATTAAAHGLTQSFGTPMLDLTQRTLQISEAAAHRRVWRDREPHLASPQRPQAPVVPVISSAKSEVPRHSWAAAAAGEASHVVVGEPSTRRWTRRRARWPDRWRATSIPRRTAR